MNDMEDWTPEWLVSQFQLDRPDTGVLAGLHQINWAALSHAHGAASDVPALLRATLSPDPDRRTFAFQLLHETIWHQGTIYEASAYAVPFLLAMLQSPQTPDKQSVAFLLASLIDGQPSWEYILQDKDSEVIWRDLLTKKGQTLEEKVEQEKRYLQAIRDAVKPELHLLYPYLENKDSEIRGEIATALSYYLENRDEILPILEKALGSETIQDVKEAIETAIIQLGGEKTP